MKILFLLPYVFIPPNKGNKYLIFNLLKYLTTQAECDLILLVDTDTKKEVVQSFIRSEFPLVENIWLLDKTQDDEPKSQFYLTKLRTLCAVPSVQNSWKK